MKRGTHLEYVVAHFKHDRLLHPVVLDQKVHVLLALDVLEQPCDVATESLGHVVFEILQEVRLAVEFGRLDRERVMPPRVDVIFAVRDVVKVPAVRFCESVQGHPSASVGRRNALFVGREYHGRRVVEVQPGCPVRQAVRRTVLVRVVDPARDKDSGSMLRLFRRQRVDHRSTDSRDVCSRSTGQERVERAPSCFVQRTGRMHSRLWRR